MLDLIRRTISGPRRRPFRFPLLGVYLHSLEPSVEHWTCLYWPPLFDVRNCTTLNPGSIWKNAAFLTEGGHRDRRPTSLGARLQGTHGNETNGVHLAKHFMRRATGRNPRSFAPPQENERGGLGLNGGLGCLAILKSPWLLLF